MEQQLLQFIGIFIGGLVSGILIMLVFNKLSSGTASPKGLKQEYDDYQAKVETHFEETSKKFQEMTEQYQDLYKHLSVGATSLCRPDSVAAGLADQSSETVKLEKQEAPAEKIKEEPVTATEEVSTESVEAAESPKSTDADSAETSAQDSESTPEVAKDEKSAS